jgi:hypothetical protein
VAVDVDVSNAAVGLLEALTLAAVLALAGYVVRQLRRIKRHRDEREAEQDLTRDALLGTPGNVPYGIPASPGLIHVVQDLAETLADVKKALGSNGGSTVFDGLDVLKAGQADLRSRSETLLRWAHIHTDDGNAIVESMDRSGRSLAAALESAGIEWDPHKVPPFQPPEALPSDPDQGGPDA